MVIKSIKGRNFRKFGEFKFYFHPFLNIILGKNNKGKTTLLEAIHFILTAEGFRERKEIELLKIGADQFWVEGEFMSEEKKLVKIFCQKKGEELTKKIVVDKIERKAKELKKLLVFPLLFKPEDLRISIGEPEVKRKFIDRILSILHPKYKSALLNYENALRRRNKLLTFAKEGSSQINDELKFWDDYLEKNSKIIISFRKKFVEFANENNKFTDLLFKVDYEANYFDKTKSLEQREKEIRLGYTLTGPQRDNFRILFYQDGFLDVKIYGARSHQRLSTLWLKKVETEYTEKVLKEKFRNNYKPVLLLDDVFSELDAENRRKVLDSFKGYQTFVTTTSESILNEISVPHHIIFLN